MMKLDWLFPFEKIPMGSQILIYGAGELGQEYLRQIILTNYCTIVGFIDKAAKSYQIAGVPTY